MKGGLSIALPHKVFFDIFPPLVNDNDGLARLQGTIVTTLLIFFWSSLWSRLSLSRSLAQKINFLHLRPIHSHKRNKHIARMAVISSFAPIVRNNFEKLLARPDRLSE